AVVVMVDVMRRWLGEQERHVRFYFGSRLERHVRQEVACEPSVVGSLWLPPAWRLRSSASPLKRSASASHCGTHGAPCPSHSRSYLCRRASVAAPSAIRAA